MVRRSKEELLIEFNKLYSICELFCEYERSLMEPIEAIQHREDIPTRDCMLACVSDGEATLSEIIAGTREAINDQNEMLDDSLEVNDGFASGFFQYYKNATGREYYDDSPQRKKLARTIFKRGKVADETEYRLIDGILSDVDQKIFKQKEIEKVNKLISDFDETE